MSWSVSFTPWKGNDEILADKAMDLYANGRLDTFTCADDLELDGGKCSALLDVLSDGCVSVTEKSVFLPGAGLSSEFIDRLSEDGGTMALKKKFAVLMDDVNAGWFHRTFMGDPRSKAIDELTRIDYWGLDYGARDDVVSELSDILSSGTATYVRLAAAMALVEIAPDSTARAALIEAASDGDEHVRAKAVNLLSVYGYGDSQAIIELVREKYEKDPSPVVRNAAAVSLVNMSDKDRGFVITQRINELGNGNEVERVRKTEALAEIGGPAIPYILRALEKFYPSEDADVNKLACLWYGGMDAAGKRADLIEALGRIGLASYDVLSVLGKAQNDCSSLPAAEAIIWELNVNGTKMSGAGSPRQPPCYTYQPGFNTTNMKLRMKCSMASRNLE